MQQFELLDYCYESASQLAAELVYQAHAVNWGQLTSAI